MKFFDGWSPKKGLKVFNALRAEDFRKDEVSLNAWVCLDKKRSLHRPVDGTMMTVSCSSPMEGVIRVSMVHHSGSLTDNPSFLPDTRIPVEIKEDGECAALTSGNLTLKIYKQEGFRTEFISEGKILTGSGRNKMAYIADGEENTYVKEELTVGIGEYLYGLGERFTPFVKNGQSLDIFNMNGGTNTDQVYKNIPFYLSNKGYGVLVNDSGRVSYEICSENVENVQFSIPGESLEYCVIAGPSLHRVLTRYTALTGRPALPPAWTFGLWLTTSFTTDYDEKTVMSFIDGMKERNLPLRVFHFDCFWMKAGEWCNFNWDRDAFPEPEAMLGRIKAKGLKICLWINPYIGQRSGLFEEGRKKGYFIKNKKGGVWQTDTWQPGMAIVDFTNPQACRWYQEELKKLIHMGADTFKTDFGERIPTDGVYYNGADPEKMHNYYTHLYNRCVFEVLTEELGEGEANLFARSATAGGQMYPVHWGGDNEATYPSMAESLRGGLSLSACGFGFWSHDISGFGNTATPDLYKRWTAFGMLSTHSRLHGNSSYRVPWLFDEEAVEVLRFFTGLKCRIMPYLYGNAVKTHKTGIPMMRAMVIDYREDPACAYLDRQYMLGDSLLVAPVFREDGYVDYYLPRGRWTNLITGQVITVGGWQQEHHDYMSLPVMVKENTMLAVGANESMPDYDYADGVTLHLFEPEEAETIRAEIYAPDSVLDMTAEAMLKNGVLTVMVAGNTKNWKLCLRNIKSVTRAEGGRIREEKEGIYILPEAGTQKMKVIL